MEELVSIPDDLISEESGFHGSRETQKLYNQLANAYNPKKYWDIHDWSVQVVAARGKKRLEKDGKLRLTITRVETETTESAVPKDEDGDVSMDLDRPRNYLEGQVSAKQLDEPVSEFLARLPPSRTTRSQAHDSWIWICNPHPSKLKRSTHDEGNSQSENGGPDLSSFRQLGSRLLEDYLARKAEVESENPGKQPAFITRTLRPIRLDLETSIRDLAVANSVTSGKWMLFPHESLVDRAWSIVAQAVWEGKLGDEAKVAVAAAAAGDGADGLSTLSDDGDDGDNFPNFKASNDSRNQGQRLICIYTPDFTDRSTVLRVLRVIKDLGLINHDGVPIGTKGVAGSLKTIYFKCDAYTYLDIVNGNPYKLKASMYSSKDLVPEWYPGDGGRGGRGGGSGWRR